MPNLNGLNELEKLANCRSCRRLTGQFDRLKKSHPEYWNQPVPPSGPAEAKLLILGLAPGMHGANRTGIPFTGDASGDLLFRVLERLSLSEKVRITNAVKCLPIANLPATKEVAACQKFLVPEIRNHRVILVLGSVAHRACVKAIGARQAEAPFAHGAIHTVGESILVDSYHCSRYNTQTKRLTEAMFEDVVESAARVAGLV